MIWAQLGFPLAIPAIAVMWASFAASKIKAAQLAKSSQDTETYGEGTVELLNGGSHQSRNDVDLGTKPDGTRRRAEGGEFFAVINKRNSRKYRKLIPDIIKSINNDTFVDKYMRFKDGDLSMNFDGQINLNPLTDEVKGIRKHVEKRTYIDGQGQEVVIYKNLTRKYRR